MNGNAIKPIHWVYCHGVPDDCIATVGDRVVGSISWYPRLKVFNAYVVVPSTAKYFDSAEDAKAWVEMMCGPTEVTK